jgi:hypothetical protein
MAKNNPSSGTIPGVTPSGDDADATSQTQTSQPFSGQQGDKDRKVYGMRRSTVLMALMFLVGIGWVGNEIRKVRAHPEVQPAPEDAVTIAGVKMVAESAMQASQSSDTAMAALAATKPLRGSVQSFDINPFETLIEPPPEPVDPEPEKVKPEEPTPAPEPETPPPPVAGLTLDLIMTSSRGNRASISGRLLSEGDKIQGWTIKKIQSNYVVLQWKDVEHILRVK